ncbi:MAG: hypothetical protein BroJett021_25150 [Chloroflexota bacterium]|nr:MAG: hypothetical protein BroJett021_25150 [Chloroflexota bacterium]
MLPKMPSPWPCSTMAANQPDAAPMHAIMKIANQKSFIIPPPPENNQSDILSAFRNEQQSISRKTLDSSTVDMGNYPPTVES